MTKTSLKRSGISTDFAKTNMIVNDDDVLEPPNKIGSIENSKGQVLKCNTGQNPLDKCTDLENSDENKINKMDIIGYEDTTNALNEEEINKLNAAQEAAELETRTQLGVAYNERLDVVVRDDTEAPLVVPKLLQLENGIDKMAEKTKDLKTRGEQLDLLLLKAESYSHFIKTNQEMFQLNARPEDDSIKGKHAKGGKKRKQATKQDATPQEIDERQPRNMIGGRMMGYQLDGLHWLASLWENGLSGILADEMGLGKTIQVISLIAHLRLRTVTGPFLIAGPLATLPNWINEFKKWLPSCPCALYHGSKEDREDIRRTFNDSTKFSVVVTSFEICIIDRPQLERYNWQFLILDEGHRIKNRNCRLVKELKQYSSVSRLLLTGTPIQNSLDELWSLLNFVNPQIFDDLEVFQEWFGFRDIGKETQVDDIVGTEKQERVVTKLHEILRPFLLRRIKKDVLIKMPPKKEIVIYCHLSSLQRDYYSRVMDNTIRDTLISMKIEGASTLSQSNQTMNLRKVCNHPFLFGEPQDERGVYLGDAKPHLLVMASGKFKLLERMLPKLKADGHKVLIFSQMTKLMDILQDYLDYKKYGFCRLDGSTDLEIRQKAIDDFNKDENIFCFLLSTRAGGQGINLAAADTVILFDSDWNPHMDAQAEARCHRIGQTKPVITYRLLTAGSVEIDMMEKQISKKKLERLCVEGGDFRKAGERVGNSLTISRLKQLLEDDVKDMGRNQRGKDEIDEEELSLIMDRNKVFVEGTDSMKITGEGKMYDVVVMDKDATLGGVGY